MTNFLGRTYNSFIEPDMVRYQVEFYLKGKPSGMGFLMDWDERYGKPNLKNVIDYLKEMDYAAYDGLDVDNHQYEVYAKETQ